MIPGVGRYEGNSDVELRRVDPVERFIDVGGRRWSKSVALELLQSTPAARAFARDVKEAQAEL